MSVTPLYTAAELDTEIAQAKKDLAAARRALSYQHDTASGTRRQAERDKVKAIQDHLEWLQDQRVRLAVGHGPQILQGRVKR